MTLLGTAPVERRRAELPRLLYLLRDRKILVHLCNGEVEEIAPATAIYLTGEAMYVLLGEVTLKAYPRKDVFFATQRLIGPIVLS